MSSTGHPVKSVRSRRRPLLLLTLLGGLLLLGWFAYRLATFDLNDFRSELEAHLSERFAVPVRVGRIDYRLHDIAISLHVTELRAGTAESSLEMQVPQLWLDLLWRGLLRGEIRFGRITLDTPKIRVGFAAGEPVPGDGPGPPAQLLRSLETAGIAATLVRSLEFNDAALVLHPIGSDDPTQRHEFHFSGLLTNLGGRQLSEAEFRGDLQLAGQPSPSPFYLTTSLDQATLTGQTLPRFDLELRIAALDLAAVHNTWAARFSGFSMDGTADMQLHADGRAGEPASFRVAVQGGDLRVGPADVDQQLSRIGVARASGRWQWQNDRHQLYDLAISLDGNRLSGAVTWVSGPPASWQVVLGNSVLQTSLLWQWLPVLPVAAGPGLEHLDPARGEIWIEQGRLAYAPPAAETAGRWHLESIQGTIRNLAWNYPGIPGMLEELQIAYAGEQAVIPAGQARIGATPVAFSGRVDFAGATSPQLALVLESSLSAPELLQRSGLDAADLIVAGQVPVQVQMHGPLAALKLDIQAVLRDLSLSHGDLLRLTPEASDQLTLNCIFAEQQLVIEHAALQWSTLKGHFNGRIPLAEPETLHLEGLVTLPDLATLSRLSPPLREVVLQGQADLAITQRGLPADHQPKLVLTLRQAGVRTGGVIADLSRINGRIHLSAEGLVSERLQAYLGESPLTVEVRLDDFRDPVLDLRIEARSIRADELIFSSDRSFLRNLKGRVLIDPTTIRLDPVTLELDRGTNPVIHGRITTAAPVMARLDISADFAHIEEVIGLWAGEKTAAREARRPQRTPHPPGAAPQVTIHARAAAGELYGMRFHDAVGTITPTRGRLVIHPLDFRVGEGFCNAQVLVDYAGEGPSLLRISGHAEDVDALEVYRELLNRENIVRGRLRGDFYLQGQLGSKFLPTSFGRFNIEIRDGVLHKFPVLSKVFSLLNVAQLFNFQLPDMDHQGMPFKLLTANLLLDQGVLGSTDLVIRSEAMNQAYQGEFDLVNQDLDLVMAVHPLGTVDKVVSRLPIAGWLLTGEDRTLVTAHFTLKGPVGDIRVTPIPINSLSDKAIGLLRRTLRLPFKLIEDPKSLWGQPEETE